MKRKKEFIGRLIGEMTNYLLESDPLMLVVSLHHEQDGAHISFFDDRIRTDKELKKINDALNPKNSRPELAGYYGSMAGNSMSWSGRLDLIGWQIKGASVKNSSTGIHIDLWLGSDEFMPEQFTINQNKK